MLSEAGTSVVVRPGTDMDLCGTALLYARDMVGDGPYVLTVPPELQAIAERCARVLDGAAVRVERIDQYIDSWSLSNGRRTFYTIGA